MKKEKIGVGFHMVANIIHESYDKGEEPKEMDLEELYKLSKEFIKDYEGRHIEPPKEEPQPSYEELVKDLKGMKFFIVRWCGDANTPSSYTVDDPIKFFEEYYYGIDVVKDLKEMTVGEKYNVDEMMQDIEILRYE